MLGYYFGFFHGGLTDLWISRVVEGKVYFRHGGHGGAQRRAIQSGLHPWALSIDARMIQLLQERIPRRSPGGRSRWPRAATVGSGLHSLWAEAGALMTSFQAVWNLSISLRVPTVMRT